MRKTLSPRIQVKRFLFLRRTLFNEKVISTENQRLSRIMKNFEYPCFNFQFLEWFDDIRRPLGIALKGWTIWVNRDYIFLIRNTFSSHNEEKIRRNKQNRITLCCEWKKSFQSILSYSPSPQMIKSRKIKKQVFTTFILGWKFLVFSFNDGQIWK